MKSGPQTSEYWLCWAVILLCFMFADEYVSLSAACLASAAVVIVYVIRRSYHKGVYELTVLSNMHQKELLIMQQEDKKATIGMN